MAVRNTYLNYYRLPLSTLDVFNVETLDFLSVKIAGDHQLFVFFNLEQITVIKHRMAGGKY